MKRTAKYLNKELLWFCCLTLLISATALGQIFGAKGFKFPIPFEGTNQPAIRIARFKSLLTLQEIAPFTNNVFRGIGMRIENYQQDGTTNLIARAPECLFDQQTKTASSTNRLELESPNGLTIEGIGFLCYLTNSNLIISNEVHTVVLQQMLQGAPGLRPGAVSTNKIPGTDIALIVMADRFDLDHAANLITYMGHVILDHAQMQLRSDILRVRRGTNGVLQEVVAEKNVSIFNKADNSTASGDLAIYTPGVRELIELSGHAAWHDDQRQSRADLFLFEPRTRHLRAEGQAWMSLPRESIRQPELLSSRAVTNQSRSKASSPSTNAPVEISAEVLDLQMPSTNQPARFLLAERSVIIVSPGDKSRATSDRAVFDELTGVLQLGGNAFWQAGDRTARGQVLQYDRTNGIFMARRDAYLKVPISEMGARFLGQMAATNAVRRATNSPPLPQFMEVYADEYTYSSNLLVFRDNVRGKVLQDQTVAGTINCAFLGLRFSNQLETAMATGKVKLEQLPIAMASSNRLARNLECEQLQVKMSGAGTVERLVALTNVVADQYEWRKGSNQPVHSRFSAEIVTADFFPRTNQVEQAVAEKNVLLVEEQRRAKGDRAVYTGTNDVIELTGNPFAESGEGTISNAEVLVWDRRQGKFSGKGRNTIIQGVVPSNRSNQQAVPLQPK